MTLTDLCRAIDCAATVFLVANRDLDSLTAMQLGITNLDKALAVARKSRATARDFLRMQEAGRQLSLDDIDCDDEDGFELDKEGDGEWALAA